MSAVVGLVAPSAQGTFSKDTIVACQVLQRSGLRLAVLASPALHEQLVTAQIPHVHLEAATEIPLLFKDRLEIVVTELDGIEKDEATLQQFLGGPQAFLRTVAAKYNSVALISTSTQRQAYLSEKYIKDHASTDGSVQFPPSVKRELGQALFKKFASIDAALSELIGAEKDIKHNVLVVGNGGREHAIAWKLAQSPVVNHVYVAPGNGGTANSDSITNVPIKASEHQQLIQFSKENDIKLCVVGPEAPLVVGLADDLNNAGIPTFGPSAKAAQLEASKAFSKDFMARNNIPTAAFKNFTQYDDAKAYIDSIDHNVVVKASGIAAGKGVLIPQNKDEAYEAIKEVMLDKAFGDAGDEVVIEEFMTGEEVSLLCFCDGENVVTMPGAQDHKRIYDNDKGPNTGGMGVYAPAPCFTKEIEEECKKIVKNVIDAMKNEGTPYSGVLYAGFMLTPNGPKVLEFNCRFGDPETQVLLPLLNSDLFEICLSCVNKTLKPSLVTWKTGACATVVMASGGYPDSYPKGKVITGIEDANKLENIQVFHAGTALNDSGLVTSGGRVLAVSAWESTLESAIKSAYKGVEKISFDGMQYRKDIGLKGLLHSSKTVKIGVLGSTRGSSLQPVIDAIENGELNAKIEVVISNKSSSGILGRARKHNLEAISIPSKDLSREEFDQKVSDLLKSKGVELVLLVGYMRILSGSFCKEWENRALNVHPSLLPEFAGGMDLEVHKQVLEAKKKESGCTVHFVTEEVDSGPIAVQSKCPVLENDSPESLKARVQALEGESFIHAIKLFQTNMLETKGSTITYADAGVSIDAGNELVEVIKPYCKSTRRVGCDADLGGFGGLFDLQAAGYDKDTVLVACTDGVGTKLKIAHTYDKHDTVGIDLVAMCVNDLIVQGAEPLFFLDYYACGKLEVKAAADVVKGIAEGCRQSVCGLIGGETAEMPSMYSAGDYDLAGFCIGAVEKKNILPRPVKTGDVVLGLASAGVHSNGFSLVRKLVEVSGLKYSDPSPFDKSSTLGESLLTPTKIYVKQLLPVIKSELVNALAHITGGGLIENIPRVLAKHHAVEIDCSSWELPPVFKWLQKVGNLPTAELARTFNCGIGMVLVVPQENVGKVTSMVQEAGETVYQLGTIIDRVEDSEQVLLQGSLA